MSSCSWCAYLRPGTPRFRWERVSYDHPLAPNSRVYLSSLCTLGYSRWIGMNSGVSKELRRLKICHSRQLVQTHAIAAQRLGSCRISARNTDHQLLWVLVEALGLKHCQLHFASWSYRRGLEFVPRRYRQWHWPTASFVLREWSSCFAGPKANHGDQFLNRFRARYLSP